MWYVYIHSKLKLCLAAKKISLPWYAKILPFHNKGLYCRHIQGNNCIRHSQCTVTYEGGPSWKKTPLLGKDGFSIKKISICRSTSPYSKNFPSLSPRMFTTAVVFNGWLNGVKMSVCGQTMLQLYRTFVLWVEWKKGVIEIWKWVRFWGQVKFSNVVMVELRGIKEHTSDYVRKWEK